MNSLIAAIITTAVVMSALGYLVLRALVKAKSELLETQIAERDKTLNDTRAEILSIRSNYEEQLQQLSGKLDNLERQLLDTTAEKARLQGQMENTDQLRSRVEVLTAERDSLGRQLERARTAAEEAERAREEAVAAKTREAQRLIEEKESSLQAQLAEKDRHIEEQKRLLAEAEKKLAETFDALSMKALKSVTEQFLETSKAVLATAQKEAKGDLELKQQAIDSMLKPVAESIAKLQAQHEDLEKKRLSAFDQIEKGLATISRETGQLANALRKPTTRGAWGEMNLETILTNAGLVQGVQYDIQDSTEDVEGERRRTDVIIHLPHGRDFIIDSKAPLESYWDGMNSDDETMRIEKFAAHARLVREHVKRLASKTYWSRYKSAPDCVVMFIPTEGAYMAAIEADPSLLTDAQKSRIYLANPMTLVNMIHVTAYVLKEETLKQNAHEVQESAVELYERLKIFVGKFAEVGRNLRITVGKYNESVGSLEGRVFPQARRIHALGAGKAGELPPASVVEDAPREFVAPEARQIPDTQPSLQITQQLP
jgi:DNA recombination protein RmuC